MKKSQIILPLMVAATLGLSSCAPQLADYYTSPSFAMGSVSKVIPCTVITAHPTVIQADPNSVAAGTIAGAAVGAGAGQLLGGGSGRAASTIGFGLFGSWLGNMFANSAARRPGQALTIQIDKTGQTYSIIQPIFIQFGEIQAGSHGNLRTGNGFNTFAPDGF